MSKSTENKPIPKNVSALQIIDYCIYYWSRIIAVTLTIIKSVTDLHYNLYNSPAGRLIIK